MTPISADTWTDQDIADLMNETAEQMYADGELDKPVTVSRSWVGQLRRGVRNGQLTDVGSRSLMVFARTLGVPFGYFAGDPQAEKIGRELADLIALKADTRTMSVAYRLANLPDEKREEVLNALDRAEKDTQR